MNNALVSWEFCLIKLLLLAMVSFALDQPVGSIEGRIALEQKGFGLYTYDMRGKKVYVLARGPRGKQEIERGVWVQPDGRFRFDQLPVGEYSLTARATGYATSYETGIFVEEGKATRIPGRIAMDVQEPSVSVASNFRVFTTRESPHFWINATGATAVVVKVYRKDFLPFLNRAQVKNDWASINTDLNIYQADAATQEYFKQQKPVRVFTRELQPDRDDWARAEFQSQSLPPGDYFVVAEASNPIGDIRRATMWFSVSNLGLIVKQDPEKAVARAIDLNTLKPLSGVQVEFMRRTSGQQLDRIGTAKTGEDGFVVFSLPAAWKNTSLDLVCYGMRGSDRAYSGFSIYQSDNDRHLTYFYTERPVYRLGQTVYYKGICRIMDAQGFKTVEPGTQLNIVVEDPENQKMWEGELKTNRHGTFNGVFQIPPDARTGAYQVTVTYPNGAKTYDRFEVAQYRKPEYQVEVIPLTPRVVGGQKIKARVKATYFFGAPVTGARVKYSVYASADWQSRLSLVSRPDYYSFFDDWGDEEGSYYGGYGGDFITEGYAQTDDAGEAIIEFESRRFELPAEGPCSSECMDRRYKIEAEVTDLSRMSVVSSAICQVTMGDFALLVQPKGYVVKAGEPVAVNVTAMGYDAQPLANQEVTLTLTRWVWDRVKYTYKGQEVAGQATVKTDASGNAFATFSTRTALPTDTYYVVAEATDFQQHVIRDDESIWIASQSYPYTLSEREAEREPVAIKLDKPVYRPGETAKVMITAPVRGDEGAEAIVAVEGLKIFNYRAVPMKATAQLVEVPISRSYTPNVYLTVTFVGKKHEFYSQSKLIKVSPGEHFLKLTVDSDRKKYKPGETVTYTVKASRPDGKPAANVELSLGVVDESIYAIRPEVAPNIQKFFYSRRSNWVTTVCSFPEQYSGGPDKIEPRMRKDFRDTAAWLPDLLTDANGMAVARVKLPDNLTTWRATVRGVSTQTDVGWAVNKVISTQDMILRLALPRFYCEGDEGVITAVVHNYTEKPQAVDLTLAASSHFQVGQPLVQHLNVSPDKASRFDWPVKVVQAGEATVTARATGQTAADALERKIPVRALGVAAFTGSSGLLGENPDRTSLPVGLSADASPGTAKFTLCLAGSTIGPVLGNFSSLIDYPYGCTEQTMSRLMPSVVAMRLHQSLGLSLTDKDKDRFQAVYKQAMQKLTDYQRSDGGWGWWRDDSSSAYLTAHVLEGFHLLHQAGYRVDKGMIDKGLSWLRKASPELQKQLKDPIVADQFNCTLDARIDLGKMIYVLGLYGDRCPAALKESILSDITRMSPEALSYLTLAFHNAGDKEAASKVYDRLVALANQSQHYTNWDHTRELYDKLRAVLRYGDYAYTYRFTGVESTALALRAVLAMEPGNTQRIESIKEWLVLQRDKDGWQNTKTTAAVFIALLEDELAARRVEGAGFKVSALLDKSPLAKLAFSAANIYAPENVLNVALSAEPSNLTIEKTGPGRLYYNSLLTFVRHLKPDDVIADKSLPRGIHLKRSFFRLTPDAVAEGGKVHFKATPLSAGQLKAGETILMRIFLETPIALPYIILETPLPSGGEVVADDPRAGQVELESDAQTMFVGDWGPWWWTHQDILDDRIVFFITSLPAGRSEFHTMVRMEMPGKFNMNPLNLEGMYTKRVRAYSSLDSLQVTE